jgi:hypothetical protein
VAGARLLDVTMSGASVLVAFGLVSLATLLVSLLEAAGYGGWAVGSLIAAVTAEIIGSSWDAARAPGIALVIGASVVVVASLPVAVFVLTRPATTLATRLRIT